jgi:hypothetical protein
MVHPRAVITAIAAIFAIRPAFATVLPLPRVSPDMSSSDGLLTTKIYYQQGLHSMNDMHASRGMCNAHIMATGDLSVGWCEGLTTSAVSISRIPGKECVLMMFRGSGLCGVDAMEIVSEPRWRNVESLQTVADEDTVSQENIPIPNGQGEICIVTGVVDGGKFAVGSAYMACG